MPGLWAVWYPLGCSIGWLSVPVFTLVSVVAFAQVVGGSLFCVLVPGLWACVISGRYVGWYA